MLIDDRPGENKGTILEHPLFDQFRRRQEQIPDSLTKCVVELAAVEAPTFFDPIGKDDAGKDYAQPTLAAHAPVQVKSLEDADRLPGQTPDAEGANGGSADATGQAPNVSEVRRETGLHVVVVEDLDSIIAPARDLGKRLGRLAALAGVFFLMVATLMWVLVARMLRDSKRRLERTFSPGSESSILESMETVGAPLLGSKTQDRARRD